MPIISNITPLSLSAYETYDDFTTAGDGTATQFPYQVVGDRYEYWTDDTSGLFYVKLQPPVLTDQLTVIILKNTDTLEYVEVAIDTYANTTGLFSFTVDVDALELGNYTVDILLLNGYCENEGGGSLGGTAPTTLSANGYYDVIISESITPLGLSTTETTGSGQYIVTGLSFEVLGDRLEFWSDDDIGMFYAYIPIPASTDVSTVIKVLDSSLNVIDQVLIPYIETTNRFSFQVNVENLNDGDFSIEVYTQSNLAIGEGGFNVSGDATYGISRYDHFSDGIGLFVNGSADVASTGAASFNYAAEGGMTTDGEAIYANSYHVFTADGGVITDTYGNDAGAGILGYFHIPDDTGIAVAGSGDTFNGAPSYESDGLISLSGNGRYAIASGAQAELNKFECIEDQSFWCEENEDCILKEEKVIYNGALIPAYTVCNSNKEVKRVTRTNVERNV